MRIILSLLLVIVITPILIAQKTLTGTIINGEDNLPLIGATVVIKGTTIGTITNFDGQFTIEVPDDAQTLQIMFVGFVTQEFEIGDRTEFNTTLMPDVMQVNEVVVTALGIKREKKALGYGVTDIKSDEIAKSNNTNIANSLAARVPGISISSSSGAAGASAFIEVRGAVSITRSNRPLVVIDGVPVNDDGGAYGVDGVATSDRLSDLNPEDVENISVLKGGAASALYGLRAANGAIVITTKKGGPTADGKIKVSVHSSVTFDKISQAPELQKKYVQGSYYDADEYFLPLLNRQYERIGSPDGIELWRKYSWGPSIDSLTYTTDPNYIPYGSVDGNYGGDYESMADYMKNWDPNGRIVYKEKYRNDPDFKDQSLYFRHDSAYGGGPIKYYNPYDFFQTGLTFSNSVSVSGGDDQTSYYVSYSNTNQEGVVPNNTFVKNNIKFSGSTKVSKKLTVGSDISYNQNSGNRIQQGSNASGLMLGLLRTPFTFDNSYGYQFDDGTQRNYQGFSPEGYDNPYWVINNITYTDKINRVVGNINLNYSLFSWANLSYKIGMDWYNTDINSFFDKNSLDRKDGYVRQSMSNNRDLNSDLILSMNKEVHDFNLRLMLGNSVYQSVYNSVSVYSNEIIISGWNNIRNAGNTIPYEGNWEKRMLGFFGEAAVEYRSMLFLSYTGRQDWSTTLPEGKNKFYYPSYSAGFIFTELAPLQDNDILPFGKARVSYAVTAKDGDPYRLSTSWLVANTADGWTSGIRFPYDNIQGFTLDNTIGNVNLNPEIQSSFELGIDLRFVNNRFNIDFAWFNNKNEKLLMEVPVPSSSGYDEKYTNIGTMKASGIELLSNIKFIQSGIFSWNIVVNFTRSRSEVTFLADKIEEISIHGDLGGFGDPEIFAVLGQQYRQIYGSDWLTKDGVYILNDDPSKEKLGYPIPDFQNLKVIGSVEPDYKVGVTNMFGIGPVSISMLIDYKKGGQMWNGTKGALYYFGTHKDTETRETETKTWKGLKGHLNEKGELVHFDANGVEQPGAGAVDEKEIKLDEYWYKEAYGSVFNGPQSQFIEETDWFRLREVSVSYSLNKILEKSQIKSLEIYFTGKNLILITPYSGVDPETSLFGNSNAQGIEYFNMPGTRSYTFGLRLGL